MPLALSLTGLQARVIKLEDAQSALPTLRNVSERLGTFTDDLLVSDNATLTHIDDIDRIRESLRALNISIFNHIGLFVEHTGNNPFGHHIVSTGDPSLVSFPLWDAHTGDASAHHTQVAQTGLVTTDHWEGHTGASFHDAHPTQAFWGGWAELNFSVSDQYAGMACNMLQTRSSSGDNTTPIIGRRGIKMFYPGMYVCDANIGFEITIDTLQSGQGLCAIALNDEENVISGCEGTTAMSLRIPPIPRPNCTASARQLLRINSGDVVTAVQRRRYSGSVGLRAARLGTNFSMWRIGD